MNKKPLILIALIFQLTISWSQVKISGIVISKVDGLPIPGVIIIEKGTQNGTQGDFDGNFTLEVSNKNSTLIISYLGYITKEISLKGRLNIDVELKEDCSIDWFDSQHIGLYLKSGVINNPIGGQINFTFPDIFGFPRIKSGISYQTDLKDNRFLTAELNFHHLFVSCDFNADINSSYRNLDFNNNIDLSAFTIESSLNFKGIKAIVGFSTIDFTNVEDTQKIKSSGPTLGLGTWINSMRLSVSAKTTFYKNLNEYHIEVNRQYSKISSFIKFYKVDDFYELSIGVGVEFTYLFRKQKEYLDSLQK